MHACWWQRPCGLSSCWLRSVATADHDRPCAAQNEDAEELMRAVEREEEAAASAADAAAAAGPRGGGSAGGPGSSAPPQLLHLAIINLVIGTLYCSKAGGAVAAAAWLAFRLGACMHAWVQRLPAFVPRPCRCRLPRARPIAAPHLPCRNTRAHNNRATLSLASAA